MVVPTCSRKDVGMMGEAPLHSSPIPDFAVGFNFSLLASLQSFERCLLGTPEYRRKLPRLPFLSVFRGSLKTG